MKNAIITISLAVLCSLMIVLQLDVNQMEREGYIAKQTADHMADAAGISLNLYQYSQGYLVFSYDEAAARAVNVFKKSLNYNDSFIPLNDYYSDGAVVDLYFFDQSLVARHYQNGALTGSFSFSMGDAYSLYVAGLEGVIDRPCVCCVLNLGKPRLRMGFASGLGRIKKTSIYTYE